MFNFNITGMKNTLINLRKILSEHGLIDNPKIDISDKILIAIKIQAVREMLDINDVIISDLSNTLDIQNNGRLYAIRMDLNTHVDNHKKFVVASLILKGVLNGNLPNPEVDTLIDGGNFNSAKALKFYCERFGMKGIYIMSKLFPQDILNLLQNESFSIMLAPDRFANRREVEFYEYLFGLMKKHDFRKNKYCLWHAKHGGNVTKWLGGVIIAGITEKPDFIVSCLGAGSTLEGVQIPVKEKFGSKIIIPEHVQSQLFAKTGIPTTFLPSKGESLFQNEFREVAGVPHMVIGPHYDEINPLITKNTIQQIDEVIVYQQSDWQKIEHDLKQQGISVGNSSAANLACSKYVADNGKFVLTIIFEPQRQFYVNA